MEIDAILQYASAQRTIALQITEDLRLMERWGRFGRPVLVGAVAYDLVYGPDIDMEIYCSDLRIEHGFQVLSECCSLSPQITSAAFRNHLHDADKALYWQLNYRQNTGTEWKIDMWSASEDYDLPRGETIVEPIKRSLTRETRALILQLKQRRANDPSLSCLSIDLYRAVLDGGVRDIEGLRNWLAANTTGELTDWKPATNLP
ncbi:MAG: hypothetical protein C4527_14765 [Candidatus Omnitrophota bacterium]|jgi:hypothetical protein|nr:MAG: hypothetical protein C4527_14765 [Candidatus Omnitrophota bacterium]